MSFVFQNHNSEPLLRWFFRRSDNLERIAFFYISRTNANNARYGPLFESTQNIRLVYLRGLPIKYSDNIMLFIFRKIPHFLSWKIKKYNTLHIFDLLKWPITNIQILHIDDPEYTIAEIVNLKKWERNLKSNFATPILVCTNQYSHNWYKRKLQYSKILIVEQGFSITKVKKTRNIQSSFTCVYSSPYIHYGDDKHGLHSTWGSKILIDEIIPNLFSFDPSIRIRLIGELGKCAKQKLERYTNWHSFGRVDFIHNQVLISECDLGIYPRMFDHRRSILKIMSYIGAGLPVVTFDLIDTNIIKKNHLGPVVKNVDEFIFSIIELKNSSTLLNQYRTRINAMSPTYSWRNLANKMETEVNLLELYSAKLRK